VIAQGAPADAKAAADALGLYRHDESLQQRVQAALDARRPTRHRARRS